MNREATADHMKQGYMKRKMTFTEFRNTRKSESVAEYIARVGDTGEIYEDSGILGIESYCDVLWIARMPDEYTVQLGRSEFGSKHLIDIEAHLYAWAFDEGYCEMEGEQ